MQKIFFSVVLILSSICHSEDIIDTLFEHAENKRISFSKDFEKYFTNGENYFKQSAFVEASESFIAASSESIYHPASHFYLAFSLFASQQYELGGDILRRTISLYPNWDKLDFNFQTFFPDNFEFQRKKEEFERWLVKESRKENTYLLFGFLCQFSEDQVKAQRAYELVLAKNYAHIEAQKLYEVVSKEKANSFYLSSNQMRNLAESYLDQGKFSYAINEWGNIFALYPNQPDALYGLAHSLFLNKKFSAAISSLVMAFNLSPNKFEQQFSIENSFGRKSYFEEAMESLESEIEKNSKNLDYLFLWSYLSFLNGEKDRVKIALEHLRKKNHRFTETDFLWKKFLEGPKEVLPKKRKKTSPKPKEKVSQKKPSKKFSKYPPGLQEALSLFYKGEHQEAARLFTKQITNPRNSKDALWLLCMTSFAMGKYDATYGILKKVVLDKKIQPLDWVQFYPAQSLFEKQIKQLAETVRDQPDNTKALSLLGYLLATTGNKKQAQAIFTKLVQRIPNDEFGNFVLQLLKN